MELGLGLELELYWSWAGAGPGLGWGRGWGWSWPGAEAGAGAARSVFIVFSWCFIERDQSFGDHPAFSSVERSYTALCCLGLSSCPGWGGGALWGETSLL